MGNTSSVFADDDPYEDMPLWELGVCRTCGEITQDADANYCNDCQEMGE